MSLRIGYITDERYPSVHTDCQQIIKTVDSLGQVGCEVDLIVPRMARHVFTKKRERERLIAEYFNVEGHYRLVDLLAWPASDWRVEKLTHGFIAPVWAERNRYDVIYTRNVLPLVLTAVKRLPVLFETYRQLPTTEPLAWRVVASTMKRSCFLGIATHSEYVRQLMIRAGAPPDGIAAIPNGFEPAEFEGLPSRAAARLALSLPHRAQLAVYTGHIREDKGIASLVDLAEDCPEVTVVIVGGAPREVEELEKKIQGRALTNLVLVGQVAISRVPLYLVAADVLVLPPTAGPLKSAGRTVLPMKTFSYLAAGRPIIAPDLPDTEGVLKHEINCLRVEPDNRRAAAGALERLSKDFLLASQLGEKARLDAQNYTWRRRAERLVEFINQRLSIQREC